MNPLITIVIQAFDNETYFIRCLNSIIRQTYNNVEIFVVKNRGVNLTEYVNVNYTEVAEENKFESFNTVIEQSQGDYLFFIDITTVMPQNLLEDLVSNMNDCNAVKVLRAEGNKIENKRFDECLVTGKVLERKILVEKDIKFDSYSMCPEVDFVSRYYTYSLKLAYIKGIYMYNNVDKIDVNVDSNYKEDLKQLVGKISKGFYCENTILCIVDAVMNSIRSHTLNDNNFLLSFITILNLFEEKPEICCRIAEDYFKEVFEQCIENEDEEMWVTFREAFLAIKNPYLLKCLLYIFGLDLERWELMKYNSLKHYIYYTSFSFERGNVQSVDISKVLNAVQLLNKKIDEKNSVPLKNVQVEEPIYQVKYPQGIELGEYVINEYESGRLGAKYIIKFFAAWFKYKLKK